MLECKCIDGLLIVSPVGKLDSGNAQSFEEALNPQLDTASSGVVFDLSGLDYISSAGLRVVLRVFKQLQAKQLRFMLAGLNPLVREVFEISGFLSFFEAFDDLGQALESTGQHKNA